MGSGFSHTPQLMDAITNEDLIRCRFEEHHEWPSFIDEIICWIARRQSALGAGDHSENAHCGRGERMTSPPELE